MATAARIKEPRFERATGTVGAWVRNFALTDPDNSAAAPTLQRALAEHGVLFFDFGRVPAGDEFTAFASLFGNVQAVFGQQKKERSDDEVPFIDSDRNPMKDNYINWWHSDGGPLPVPPLAAMLTPLELPETGGDTMWSSMTAAYDALSPAFRAMLDRLEIVNNNGRTSFLQPKEHVHPAVVVNPITGRRSLYYNPVYTERFVGLADKESDALCRFLTEHINTPEFHVRLGWRLGVAAVWHQQVVWHRGVDDFTGPRKLKRLTVDGAPLVPVRG